MSFLTSRSRRAEEQSRMTQLRREMAAAAAGFAVPRVRRGRWWSSCGGAPRRVCSQGSMQIPEPDEEPEDMMPLYGSRTTMNMNNILHTNILESSYFRQRCGCAERCRWRPPSLSCPRSPTPLRRLFCGSELLTFEEILDEIRDKVTYLGAFPGIALRVPRAFPAHLGFPLARAVCAGPDQRAEHRLLPALPGTSQGGRARLG